jgi:hypothetical protein
MRDEMSRADGRERKIEQNERPFLKVQPVNFRFFSARLIF